MRKVSSYYYENKFQDLSKKAEYKRIYLEIFYLIRKNNNIY